MASQVFYMSDRASSLGESTPFKALSFAAILHRQDRQARLQGGYQDAYGRVRQRAESPARWVKVITDEVKRLGGYPYVVDCTTVTTGDYSGRAPLRTISERPQGTALTRQRLAAPSICDGELGLDDVQVEVPNGVFLKHVWMGKKLADFDSCIVISHFKGHSQGVYGGAIKNCGIGMGSKRGKLGTHFYPIPTSA